MTDKIALQPELEEILKFKPFPIPDPVPFWIVKYLKEDHLARLAIIEMDMRNEIIEATLKANNQAMEVLKGMVK